MSGANVREETADDHAAVHRVHAAAFGGEGEACLVDALRTDARPLVSLVSEQAGDVVGHILFSPVTIHDGSSTTQAMGLAPVGVLPEHQSRKLGDQLCRAGLDACRALGETLVFVLGHPTYYPRFGFEEAFQHGLWYAKPVHNAAFMVTELVAGARAGRRGEVLYHPAFDRLG